MPEEMRSYLIRVTTPALSTRYLQNTGVTTFAAGGRCLRKLYDDRIKQIKAIQDIQAEADKEVEAVKNKAERVGLGAGVGLSAFLLGNLADQTPAHLERGSTGDWLRWSIALAVAALIGWFFGIVGMLIGGGLSSRRQFEIRKEYFDRSKRLEARWEAEAKQ